VRLLRAGFLRGWGDLRLSNLRDDSGAAGHVLLELDDITDVVAQTEYLQAAAAAGVVGVWDWDVPANVLSWDPVMYRLYGRDPGDFGGAYEAWADAVHPEDRAYAEGEIQAALRGEREYAPRFRVIWPDGSVHHVQAVSHTTYDNEGKPLRMLGVNYDVTELVQTREQLQAEQLRLSTTLDALLDPHLMLGPVRDDAGSIVDLRILRANPAAAGYNQMALDAFVGSTVRQFWPEHGANGLFDLYLEVLSSGQPLVLDSFPFQHAQQGGLRYLDIRAVKVAEELSVTWRDVTERIALEQALQQRAATDSLTALLNREEVFTQMKRLLAGDQRRGGELAVLFCDLDRFKEVNDRYGHRAGDAVLQAMADRIRSCLRTSDLAARIGGDELMVVLPGVQGLDDAVTIAEKLRQLAHDPVPTPTGDVHISLSVGVALACPGESLDELIARADTAMYAAKQQGRNQVVAIGCGSPEAGP
jgi:diguanylate cyclase (GGDEF)-like protein/PAS domain S-box-containing protein